LATHEGSFEVGGGSVGILVGVTPGDGVNVGGMIVGGMDAGTRAHPLTKTVRRTNARNFDPIDLFMTLSPFDLMMIR